MKKILILYGSIGLGHKVVAENIAQALSKYPNLEISLLDVLKLYEGPLTKVSARIYQWVIRRWPALWGFFYLNQIFLSLALPLRIPFAALKARKLWKEIQKFGPDLILSSHPTPTALVSYLKKKNSYHGPLVVTFSDFHFQPFWVYPRVDQYLVMTPEQRTEVLQRGFRSEQVVVTGLPVDQFFLKDYSKFEICRQFDLSRTKPLLLIMGGSRGWGVKQENIETLLKSSLDLQIAVVTGTDEGLAKNLNSLGMPNLLAMSNLLTQDLAKLFYVAKVLVTKPGGLTCAQALARGLPMILTNPLPTMEELNQNYLVSHGVAVAARNSTELRRWAERLLLDPKIYKEMKKNFKKLQKGSASTQAAKALIDTLTKTH